MTRGSCPDDSEDGNSMKRGGKVEKDAVWGGAQLEEDNMLSSVLLGPNNMVLKYAYV